MHKVNWKGWPFLPQWIFKFEVGESFCLHHVHEPVQRNTTKHSYHQTQGYFMTHNKYLEIYHHDDIEKQHSPTLPHVPCASILGKNVILQHHEYQQNRQHAVEYSLTNVSEIYHCVEVSIGQAGMIDVMIFLWLLPSVLLIEYGINHDRQCRIEGVEQFIIINIEYDHRREVGVCPIGDNAWHMVPVLKEVIWYELSIFTIPLSSIVQCNEG